MGDDWWDAIIFHSKTWSPPSCWYIWSYGYKTCSLELLSKCSHFQLFTVSNNPKWCCTYLLDPTDPLFTEIGKAFVEKQLKEYGRTSHIYNCDTFDENTPPVSSPVYISSLGAAIYEGIRSGDNEAIWLMQGWLFSYDPFWKPPQMKALLHSVPYGRLVVLDLYAEVKPIWVVTEQFYGVPYIWCMLHNFAGNHEMYGILDEISRGPVEARLSNHSTLVGVGMSMEGIEQNPIVYDLMSEMAFHHEKVDPKVWVDLYSQRRYGNIVPAIQDAWKILHHTLYNCTDGLYDKNRDVIVAFPDVHPSSIPLSGFSKFGVEALELPHLWYSTSDVLKALYIFLANGEELLHINTFRYDLIDLTRQALAKHANENFLEIIRAYRLNDLEAVRSYSRNFLDLVEDLDLLLSCHEGFLLGPWLESAKLLAEGSEQKILYEWNARTLITMWFDNTDVEASLLRDYGNKYWSGLLLDYYKPRAAIYFNYLVESLEEGNSFSLEDWRRDWVSLTNEWQRSRKPFRVKASGDALNISRWLYEKYFGSIISKVELQSITQLTVL